VAVNLLETEVYGAETVASVAGPWGLQLEVSATWQRATDRSGGTFDGEPLIFHPEWLGYAGLGWRHDGWHAGWELTYTGENSIDELDTPALRLDDRLIHDVTAGYEWPGGLRIGVDVRNAFDRRTVDVSRYPLPDRTAFVHLGWRDGAER
jgi:outer membrane receptor protein involved in Fe transport